MRHSRAPVTKTRLSTDLLYGSGLRAASDHPNGNSLPDYHQINISIVQEIDTAWRKGAELRLDVINLFDEVYQIRNGTGVGVGRHSSAHEERFWRGLPSISRTRD
jgi:hypothetical protein